MRQDEQINRGYGYKATCTHRLISLPRSIGGSDEEIDHHPVTHVETVFHRPDIETKMYKTILFIHAATMCFRPLNELGVCVGLCYFQFETLKSPKKFCFVSAVKKGPWLNHNHLLHRVCVALRRTCACTVDGSSSRTRCGTGWRWWRASWVPPRRPRPTGAPTGRLTGSVAPNCPAGWG